MPIRYADRVKTRRMEVVRDEMDASNRAARLEIGTDGMQRVLVSVELSRPASTVDGLDLLLAGLPKSNEATQQGRGASARIVNGNGDVVADSLTVGVKDADVLIDNVDIRVGQTVTINGPSKISHG